MLAITLLVPKPRDAGFSTGGPPDSAHTMSRTPASISQLTESRPVSGRQRAILGRIGDELVQGQSHRLRGCRLQLNFGAAQRDLITRGIGRELLLDQLAYFGALPARQRKHGMDARQRIDPSFDRAGCSS